MRRNCAASWIPLFLLAFVAVGNLGLATSFAAEHADEHAAAAHGEADDHAADAHGGEKVNPLVFDPDLAIFTAIVFGGLVFLLGKFAWPSIMAALDEREKRIEGNIADAEAMNAEAKDMLAQHEAKLATAADQVRELLEEARRDAEQTKSQIIADAKKAADSERERAVREVDLAADRAMHKLVETSANMAVDLAGQVVKQNITPEQQAALVREALGKLASSSPSEN